MSEGSTFGALTTAMRGLVAAMMIATLSAGCGTARQTVSEQTSVFVS
jgi:hypothetical protein